MPIRVLFLTFGDERTASTRLRVLQLIPHLEASGFSCTAIPWSRERWAEIEDAAAGCDMLVIQKVLLPSSTLSRIARAGLPMVFDFDDAIWTGIRPRKWPASARVRARFRVVTSRADLVIAATPYLAEEARKHARDVIVVPTGIDLDAIQVRSHNGKATSIGWVGSCENFGYLKRIEPALSRAAAAYPDLRLRVIADRPYETAAIRVENVEWQLEDAHTYGGSFDVGLAPIDGSVWSLGKGSYKAIECMAAGVPAVASRIGYNVDLIRDGVDGFLAGDLGEWAQRLSTLIEDGELRRRMGEAARERVAETHSLSLVAPHVAEALASLLRVAPGG
jgi:glycosyltransferase involved in cell wall biosynthesis